MGGFISAIFQNDIFVVGGFDPSWNAAKVKSFFEKNFEFPLISISSIKETPFFRVEFDSTDCVESELKRLRIGNHRITVIKVKNDLNEAIQEITNKTSKGKQLAEPMKATNDEEIANPNVYIDYQEQIRLKSLNTTKEIADLLKINYVTVACVSSPKLNGFCNKAFFSVGFDKEKHVAVGFNCGSKMNPAIVPLENCISYYPVTYKIVEEFINFMVKNSSFPFNALTGTGSWKTIQIQTSDAGALVTVESSNQISQELQKKLVEEVKSANTICLKYKHNVEVISGTGFIEETLLNIKFKATPGIFLPTNPQAFNYYLKAVLNLKLLTKETTLVHIYSGGCFLSLCLANDVNKVIAIDADRRALEYACNIAKENNVSNFESHFGSVEEQTNEILSKEAAEKTIALIELHHLASTKKTLNAVINCKPQTIILGSEGTSLPREVTLFNEFYKLSSCFIVDFFPHTNKNYYVTIFSKK